MNAILLASAGVVVLLIGGGIGFWVGRSGVGGSKSRAEQAEAELEEYKRSVTEHFGQTAVHFQAIGQHYRDLYEHMASGAQVLCEPDEAGKQLLFAPGSAAASTSAEDPPGEAAAQDQGQRPVDYAEQPSGQEAADAPAEAEEPVQEQQAELADAAAEPQPEAKAEEGERTLH